MTLAQDFRILLGQQFNVAFQVLQEFHDQEPVLRITPEDKHNDFFEIKVEFKNHNRMILYFLPQKFSANMIRSMGHATEEEKKQFCSFGKLFALDNAKIAFYLNDMYASAVEYADWPNEWSKMALRISIAPLERDENDNVAYASALSKYALCFAGMILSLLDIVPAEEPDETGYEEGKKKKAISTRYERNPINRAICLREYGYSCRICGMNFRQRYGEIGDHYIHVHHIIPVSKMGDHYVVDPLNDLIPVCPNCHAMLHRTDPPLRPDELKERLEAHD